WGDKEAINYEDAEKEETSARRGTKLDHQQTYNNGPRQRIGTIRGLKEKQLW
ncbi:hypothetical protein A2U01_0118857, partial [Trifolium medium]|nr:hypothetical protein [Trifolium medium]